MNPFQKRKMCFISKDFTKHHAHLKSTIMRDCLCQSIVVLRYATDFSKSKAWSQSDTRLMKCLPWGLTSDSAADPHFLTPFWRQLWFLSYWENDSRHFYALQVLLSNILEKHLQEHLHCNAQYGRLLVNYRKIQYYIRIDNLLCPIKVFSSNTETMGSWK